MRGIEDIIWLVIIELLIVLVVRLFVDWFFFG